MVALAQAEKTNWGVDELAELMTKVLRSTRAALLCALETWTLLWRWAVMLLEATAAA